MKTLKEYIQQSKILEQAEIIDLEEESRASTTTTDGVVNPDAKPMFKKSKYLGHPCVEVDDETYHKCIRGKQPFERWAKYVEDEDLRNEMRKTFQRSKRMLVMNSRDGSMAYVK